MITLLKERPEFNDANYVQIAEPVLSIEDLETLRPECHSKCWVINDDHPIVYIAFYNSGTKNWIVFPFSYPAFLEKALQFEIDRTYKVRTN